MTRTDEAVAHHHAAILDDAEAMAAVQTLLARGYSPDEVCRAMTARECARQHVCWCAVCGVGVVIPYHDETVLGEDGEPAPLCRIHGDALARQQRAAAIHADAANATE